MASAQRVASASVSQSASSVPGVARAVADEGGVEAVDADEVGEALGAAKGERALGPPPPGGPVGVLSCLGGHDGRAHRSEDVVEAGRSPPRPMGLEAVEDLMAVEGNEAHAGAVLGVEEHLAQLLASEHAVAGQGPHDGPIPFGQAASERPARLAAWAPGAGLKGACPLQESALRLRGVRGPSTSAFAP